MSNQLEVSGVHSFIEVVLAGTRNLRTDWVDLEDRTVEACVLGVVWVDTVRTLERLVEVGSFEVDIEDDCSEVQVAEGSEDSLGVDPQKLEVLHSFEWLVDEAVVVHSQKEAEEALGDLAESLEVVEMRVEPDWGIVGTAGEFEMELTVEETDEVMGVEIDEEVLAGVVDAEGQAGVAAGLEDAVASVAPVDAAADAVGLEEDPECAAVVADGVDPADVAEDVACAVAAEEAGQVAAVAGEEDPEDANVVDDEEHHEEVRVDAAEIAVVAAAVEGEEGDRVDAADEVDQVDAAGAGEEAVQADAAAVDV